jgi:predicted class III extradiol MEMO1 family dioxygenase
MIPTPTKTEIKNLWTRFQSDLPKTAAKTRILFVPHASPVYSGHAALESFSCCINNPNKIWLFGVKHRPGTNEDHSVNINVAILRYKYPDVPIEAWFSVDKDIIGFLQESLKNVVVFTSDMSHEYSVNSQAIIDKEASLISSILERKYVPDDTISMCGPQNLYAFCKTVLAMGEYPVIRCYDDSQNRKTKWSTKECDKIVSYLSMISVPNILLADAENEKWRLVFCKAFVLSFIMDSRVRMPVLLQPRSKNGLFITIKDDGLATKACIGKFYTPVKSLFANVVDIIPDLIEDARTRWNNPFRKTDILQCSFTIMDNDSVKVPKPTSKNNLYTIECNGKKGTFIPDVWREHPEWTPKQYIQKLLEKAGVSECKSFDLYSVKAVLI